MMVHVQQLSLDALCVRKQGPKKPEGTCPAESRTRKVARLKAPFLKIENESRYVGPPLPPLTPTRPTWKRGVQGPQADSGSWSLSALHLRLPQKPLSPPVMAKSHRPGGASEGGIALLLVMSQRRQAYCKALLAQRSAGTVMSAGVGASGQYWGCPHQTTLYR
ncbi:hypothetical protein MC885_020297 [Smutsia gigantea]|nr:hypothetical protein MC885_020297 [Smutsia gigantea]